MKTKLQQALQLACEAMELRERLGAAHRDAKAAGDEARRLRVWRAFKKARARQDRRYDAWQSERLAAWRGGR